MSLPQVRESFTPRQVAAIRRIIDHRVSSERAAFRATVGDRIRNLRLAKTVARDGTYPASGDTFAIRFVDCGFSPVESGSSTLSCQDRTTEGDTNDADDVIAREINGQYVEEGTYVAALWQRGVEGDPDDYGEWWIRLKSVNEGPCWSWSDDFGGTDSTDVGPDWHEVSGGGNWEILDNELHEKVGGGGTEDAKVFCTQAVPKRSAGEMAISVDVVDAQAGDIFYIYPSCPNTSSIGDVAVSFVFDGTSAWDISVTAGDVTGTSSQVKTLTLGKATLNVCCDFSSGSVFASVSAGISSNPDVDSAWASGATFTAGRYCALGHDNVTNGATFDDFQIAELRKSSRELCITCGCDCRGNVPKKVLSASIYNAADRAACLDGEEWEMEWKWGSGSSYWEGEMYSDYITPATTIQYHLICDDSDQDATSWNPSDTQANETTLGGYESWADPSYAEVDDNINFATVDVKDTERSKYLYLSDFGFTLPAGTTVTGVEVRIQHKASVAGEVKDYGVYLYDGLGTLLGVNHAESDGWSDSEEAITYGGMYDQWGWVTHSAEVEDSGFGVLISAVGTTSTSRVASIDFVEVKVYYQYDEGYNYKLSISNGVCCSSNPSGCSALFRANVGSTCNPLSLLFGPLSVTFTTCGACYPVGDMTYLGGTYYIMITDTA